MNANCEDNEATVWIDLDEHITSTDGQLEYTED